MKGFVLALAAVLMVGTSAHAQKVFEFTPRKQTGGSTGDSTIVAPDTSRAVLLSKEAKTWWCHVASDSLASYRVQVSPNGTTLWYTVDFDSCPKGESEVSADYGAGVGFYAGLYVRVILDNLTAGGAPYGRARLWWTRGALN